jgi:hypothetical protein
VRGGNASGEFAALWRKNVLYSVNQEFLQCRSIEGAARFGSLEQPRAHRALHGSVDFRWAEKEILRDLGVGRAFVSIPEEFHQDDDVLGLQVDGNSIHLLFAKSE